jgi:hypothetical protein
MGGLPTPSRQPAIAASHSSGAVSPPERSAALAWTKSIEVFTNVKNGAIAQNHRPPLASTQFPNQKYLFPFRHKI